MRLYPNTALKEFKQSVKLTYSGKVDDFTFFNGGAALLSGYVR